MDNCDFRIICWQSVFATFLTIVVLLCAEYLCDYRMYEVLLRMVCGNAQLKLSDSFVNNLFKYYYQHNHSGLRNCIIKLRYSINIINIRF